MTGIENQILACIRKSEGAGAPDIASQIGVSTAFVQSVIDDLMREDIIVRSGSAGYAVSQDGKRRLERYRSLERQRKPFVRW